MVVRLEDIFPYSSFRTGQLELANSVYNACKNRNRLVVEAMSGFGKTAPVLAGSVLAAEEGGGRIVYACRTKRQVFRVMEEIGRIQTRIPLRTVYLFSKNDYCLLKETSSFPIAQDSFKWYCSFNVTNNLCSYFLNLSLVNRELTSLVNRFSTLGLSHSSFLAACREIHVCPYEVARLAIPDSRIVVTTYHFLFDQASRSILLGNTGSNPSDVAVIVDEAHNVREFVRDAYTSSISLSDLEQAHKDSRELHLDGVASSLQEVLENLRAFSSEHKSWYVDKASLSKQVAGHHDRTWLPNLVLELSASARIGWEAIATGRNLPVSILRAGSFLQNLLSSYELDDTTITKSDQTFFLVNTNPSGRFIEIVKDYRSLILLSATVSPSDLFLKSMGLEGSTTIHKVDLNRTFRVQTVVDTGVSTRFKLRSPEMYSRIANKITAICESVEGGIGIFMPSYTMLESLSGLLHEAIGGRNLLNETRGLNSLEAEKTMQSFKSTPGSVLLAVQGGKFSEGEDFPGDQMDVSIVVGLSLPPPSPVMYAEYARTDLTRHETYLVVSLLPALRKAIQSAGRHIRSPDKKGMVFFFDSRFNDAGIMGIMPSWLKQDVLTGDFEPSEIRGITRDFWSN